MFPTDDESNRYLQQEVLTAPPARLRWMLIRRAEELCRVVGHLWQIGERQQADQWLLRIREILGELLVGVTQGDDPLRTTIADLYVFMIQQLNELQERQSAELLSKLHDLLSIELETWRQVVDKVAVAESAAGSHGQYSSHSAVAHEGSLSLEV